MRMKKLNIMLLANKMNESEPCIEVFLPGHAVAETSKDTGHCVEIVPAQNTTRNMTPLLTSSLSGIKKKSWKIGLYPLFKEILSSRRKLSTTGTIKWEAFRRKGDSISDGGKEQLLVSDGGTVKCKSIHGGAVLTEGLGQPKASSIDTEFNKKLGKTKTISKKNVTFSTVQVREYSLTIGDHNTLALTISWMHSPEVTSIIPPKNENLELRKHERPHRLTYFERYRRLETVSDLTEVELLQMSLRMQHYAMKKALRQKRIRMKDTKTERGNFKFDTFRAL